VSSERASVGLCATCRHARRTGSARGSTFWRCALSATDPRLPKYPRLPVLTCPAFTPTPDPAHRPDDPDPAP
jgi:hypothetical protein